MHKFRLLATQCAVVAGSPTRSPTTSPVIHLRRRKTLRMLLNRTSSDRRRFSNNNRREESSELKEIAEEEFPEKKQKEIRVRRKLKDLFVSSPPFEERERNDREAFLPVSGNSGGGFGGGGGGGGGGFVARRGLAGSLRPVSATFRYRLLRRAWRPMLVTIPE